MSVGGVWVGAGRSGTFRGAATAAAGCRGYAIAQYQRGDAWLATLDE